MASNYYTVKVAAGTAVLQQISYPPLSVIVSNYSPYYIYIDDAQDWCPPWTANAIFVLLHATQARAHWDTTPFGAQAIAAPPPTYSASFAFSPIELPSSGGTIIQQPVAIVGPVTATISGPVDVSGSTGLGVSGPVTVPAGVAVTGGTIGTITNPVDVSGSSVGVSGNVGVAATADLPIIPGIFTLSGQGVTVIAVSGTRVQLHTALTVKVVMIKARAANIDTIYLGTVAVTNNETAGTGGLQLAPGDMISFTDTDIGNVYINGTATDGVSYLYWV